MQPNPPLDTSWGKYNKTLLLLEEVGPAGRAEMAVAEGTLETEFLRAGRESGEGQQEPHPCACEVLLSRGRLSKDHLDDHALMFGALMLDVLMFCALCCGYSQVSDSLLIFPSDPQVTIRQNM